MNFIADVLIWTVLAKVDLSEFDVFFQYFGDDALIENINSKKQAQVSPLPAPELFYL